MHTVALFNGSLAFAKVDELCEEPRVYDIRHGWKTCMRHALANVNTQKLLNEINIYYALLVT